MLRALPFVLAALVLVPACAPDPQAPVRVMALVQTQERSLEPTEVELSTLESLTELRGAAARIVGNARIVVDSSDPQLASLGANPSDEQLEEIFVKDPGGAPEGSFVDKDGVYWPAEFHTWNMVTTYFNFERALTYFREMGVESGLIEESKVYYFPDFVLSEVSSKPLDDNALFFSPIRGFAILPFDALQGVPLGMNLGVVSHEFSHRVFNELVYRGAAIPEPLLQWVILGGATPAINVLKSFDEGLADYHAHGSTCLAPSGCDTRFIDSSLPKSNADDRDLAITERCMSEGLRTNLLSMNTAQFSGRGLEYFVGTLLASSLYQAGERTAKQRALQEYVLQAYSDEDADNPGLAQLVSQNLGTPENFTLGRAANVLLRHITDLELRQEVCNEFLDHLQLTREELPDCPATSAGGTTCEDINP